MLNLIQQIEAATKGDANMDWVKPFSSVQNVRAGEVLFRQGDPAREMFFVVSGRLWVKERRVAIEAGEVFGELGLLDSDQARTATVECMESGQLLRISYDQVKQLYVQDPKFGFYFLHLVSSGCSTICPSPRSNLSSRSRPRFRNISPGWNASLEAFLGVSGRLA